MNIVPWFWLIGLPGAAGLLYGLQLIVTGKTRRNRITGWILLAFVGSTAAWLIIASELISVVG